MDQFDEFSFEINNLASFNNIVIGFMSTFMHYNDGNKCKDDGNKNLKI